MNLTRSAVSRLARRFWSLKLALGEIHPIFASRAVSRDRPAGFPQFEGGGPSGMYLRTCICLVAASSQSESESLEFGTTPSSMRIVINHPRSTANFLYLSHQSLQKDLGGVLASNESAALNLRRLQPSTHSSLPTCEPKYRPSFP